MLPGKRHARNTTTVDMFEEATSETPVKKIKTETPPEIIHNEADFPPLGFRHSTTLLPARPPDNVQTPSEVVNREFSVKTEPLPEVPYKTQHAGTPNGCNNTFDSFPKQRSPSKFESSVENTVEAFTFDSHYLSPAGKSTDLNETDVVLSSQELPLEVVPINVDHEIEVVKQISEREFTVIEISDEESERSTRPGTPEVDEGAPSSSSQADLLSQGFLDFFYRNVLFDDHLINSLKDVIAKLEPFQNVSDSENDEIIILSPPQSPKKVVSPQPTFHEQNLEPKSAEQCPINNIIAEDVNDGTGDYSCVPMDISPVTVPNIPSQEMLKAIISELSPIVVSTCDKEESNEAENNLIIRSAETKRRLNEDYQESVVKKKAKKIDVNEYRLKRDPRRRQSKKNPRLSAAANGASLSTSVDSTSLSPPLPPPEVSPPLPPLPVPSHEERTAQFFAQSEANWSHNFQVNQHMPGYIPPNLYGIYPSPQHPQMFPPFRHPPFHVNPAFHPAPYMQAPNTPLNIPIMPQQSQNFAPVPIQQIHTPQMRGLVPNHQQPFSSLSIPQRPITSPTTTALPSPNQNGVLCSQTKSKTPFQSTPRPVHSIPESLKEFVGQKVVECKYLHLLILNWEVGKMYQQFKEEEFKCLATEFSFSQVRNSYSDHLDYFCVYFPWLLVEFWHKLFTSYEMTSKKEYFYRMTAGKQSETTVPGVEEDIVTTHVECDTIVPTSDVAFNPKKDQVVLVSCLAGQFLAYVWKSVRRDFSGQHDSQHPTLDKNSSVPLGPEFPKSKVKLTLEFACRPAPMNTGDVFRCGKLVSLKSLLRQTGAMLKLNKSPMLRPLLDPLNHLKEESVKWPTKPEEMSLALDAISHRVVKSDHQITVVACNDPLSPLPSIIGRLHRDLKQHILVCTREEHLNSAVRLLTPLGIEVVLIDRELRRDLRPEFKDRTLDVLWKKPNSQSVLNECDVVVASAVNCFYDDVNNDMAKFDTCVMFDADRFTEPESVVCLSYGVRHLVLVGNPQKKCVGNSNMTSKYEFDKSLFKRIYESS